MSFSVEFETFCVCISALSVIAVPLLLQSFDSYFQRFERLIDALTSDILALYT